MIRTSASIVELIHDFEFDYGEGLHLLDIELVCFSGFQVLHDFQASRFKRWRIYVSNLSVFDGRVVAHHDRDG